MNIFKILARGDGSILEPSISAFLGYLVNPSADHGLNDVFLKRLLEKFNDQFFTDLDDLSIHSDNYDVEVYFEQAFKYRNEIEFSSLNQNEKNLEGEEPKKKKRNC